MCSSLSSVISVILAFVSWTCGLPGSQKEDCSSLTASTHWWPWRYMLTLKKMYLWLRLRCHCECVCVCLQEALDELATWLDAHPKEIVVISCSDFDSLTDEDHFSLVAFIIALFGKKLCFSQVTWTRNCCINYLWFAALYNWIYLAFGLLFIIN